MIDCAHYRRSLLADPGDPRPELRAHRAICPECAGYAARLLQFETRLGRALNLMVEAPPQLRRPDGQRRVFARRNWLTIAASLLLGAGVAAALWLAVPRPTLADDVVSHMAAEPQAWRRTDVPVPAPELRAVLRDAQLRLSPRAGLVTYANSCLFRGHRVPHFVVQGARGPVTVMILVHESVRAATPFAEQGYRGVILPVPGHGALAVLTRGAHDDPAVVETAAKRLLAAIIWTG